MFIRSLLFFLSCFFLATITANAEQKELSLGYVYTANPPLAHPDDSDDKGILIDIANEIGKRSGITFQTLKRDKRLIGNEMLEGKLDAAIAGIYHNEKKDENLLHSNSFLNDKVINSYRLKGLERNDLKGAGDPITGALVGAYNLMERTFHDNFNADCEDVKSGKTKYQDLQGNPPTSPCDRDRNYSANYIGLNIIRSGYFDHIFHKGVRDIDFMLVLQKKYAGLLPSLNEAITEIQQDGTIDRLFEAYLAKKKTKGILHGN